MFGFAFELETAVNVSWGVLAGSLIAWTASWFTLRRLTRHYEEVHHSFKVLARGLVQIQKHPGTVEFPFVDERLKSRSRDVPVEEETTVKDKPMEAPPEPQEENPSS